MAENILLHFDGLCEPKNPGGVAIAAWVAFDLGNPHVMEGKFSQVKPLFAGGKVVADGGPKATNNVAEWCALGFGLREVSERGEIESLLIRGDSQLVINQLIGEWAVRAEHLRPYQQRCLELLDTIGCEWQAEWVKRDLNEVADEIGRRTYRNYLSSKKK